MKYIIKKNKDEIDLYYHIRKVFIDISNPKNKKDFDLITMYSHILINMLFLKCRYENKTEKKIKEFLEKHKKNIHLIF